MEVGDFVTIHSLTGNTRENALITGEDWDSFTEEDRVFTVWHPAYEEELSFYQKTDESGHHSNVGNAAYWIE